MAGLIVACALDRIAIGVGGPNVRPDELAALALAAALFVRFVLTPRLASPSPPSPLPRGEGETLAQASPLHRPPMRRRRAHGDTRPTGVGG